MSVSDAGLAAASPVLLLSTADTELLAARRCGEVYRTANPARVDPAGLPQLLDGVAVVVLRLLGGRRAWPEGVDALLASGLPVVLLGGEASPDAELMGLSTVPSGVASQAQAYLAAGGLDNLRELHRFLSDTVLLTGVGFAPPAPAPGRGRPSAWSSTARTSCRETPRSSTRSATPSRRGGRTRYRCSAGRCAAPRRS